MLLEAEVRARLERLRMHSRRRVRALWSGANPSVRKGESLDFADYREYVPGDDFRRIDHQLWARLGVLLVRQFEAEEELPIRVVVDVSRSMGFYGKFGTARRVAAVVTYLGLSGGDRVQLYSIPGAGDRPLEVGPVGRHLSAWPRLETWLETAQLSVGGAEMSPAVRQLAGSGVLRGSLILVSDLLNEDWGSALDGLRVAGGGVVLHVLGAEELDPQLAGDLDLVDTETGQKLPLSTSGATMNRYRQVLEEFVTGAQGRARRSGLDYVLIPADAVDSRTLDGDDLSSIDRVIDALVSAAVAR